MERKFYTENFEKFLKGHADQFKMTPSKKVWHGIYNDLHPGRRWPSIAMSMVFVFTLVIIGHLNTNNGKFTQVYDLASNNSSITKSTNHLIRHSYFHQQAIANNSSVDVNNNTVKKDLSLIKDDQLTSATIIPLQSINESKLNSAMPENKNENISADKTDIKVIPLSNSDESAKPSEYLTQIKTGEEIVNTTPNSNISTESSTNISAQTTANAIHKRKKNNNITWNYYLTPSFSYRYLADSKINNSVTHRPIIGYEAGTAMSFNVFKKLQFFTGFQVNYTGYKIKANNTHPISGTILLNTETPGQYSVYTAMSHYGNNPQAELTGLKNYSLQASIPIGIQYIFAGNDDIKFGAAAAIQPSLIVYNKDYLLSSDTKNYLADPDLYRTWNMNTNFTTYVSFASNSFNWKIGPQVRYQLLSTYSDRYPFKEHLVNYGIRLSISKISK